MKIVIIEDEISACENIMFLLNQLNSDFKVIKVLDSVKSAVQFFQDNNEVDLIFMDIHLGDGIAFDIFDKVNILTPVIFTTAYDQYAIKAFKYNSIDYLLKPINKNELQHAVERFSQANSSLQDLKKIQNVLTQIQQQNKSYKNTFLVYQRESYIPVKTDDFAFFNIDYGVVRGTTHNNESFVVDKKMEDLVSEIDPSLFYRANRQFIVQRAAVKKINQSFNGKLTLSVSPKHKESIVISKAKSSDFKDWMQKS